MKESIEESNSACDELEKNGFSLQGRNHDMSFITVEKNGVLSSFESYILAAENLL